MAQMLHLGNKNCTAIIINVFKYLKEDCTKEEVVSNEDKISLDAFFFLNPPTRVWTAEWSPSSSFPLLFSLQSLTQFSQTLTLQMDSFLPDYNLS